MDSYGLFSISLRRARIRSAVVSRGDICNPRTPFTLVSSTKYIADIADPSKPRTQAVSTNSHRTGAIAQRRGQQMGGCRPLNEPSHMYQMCGSGELYELLWE